MAKTKVFKTMVYGIVLILSFSILQFQIFDLNPVGIASAEYEGKVDYSVGDGPHAVFLADLDGNGFNDIVTANYYGDSVSVLLNNGNGTYANHVMYNVDDGPRTLFLADLDNDTNVDIITGNIGTNGDSITILFNVGNGTFINRIDYDVNDDPRSVFVIDVGEDSNSDLDIVTANYWSDDVAVLKNNGDGTFANPVTYNAGNGAYGISSADFDGDGDNDLATVNLLADTISVLNNNGDGTFANAVPYPSDDGPRAIICEDVDAANGIDIIVSNRLANNVSVFLNNGGGTFATHVTYDVGPNPLSIYGKDLDDDTDIDLVTANNQGNSVSILKNYGNGTFAPQINKFVGAGPYSVFIADIGEDINNDFELITANNLADSISILITNTVPIISFIEPDGINDIADTQYTITWSDNDPDDNANISLYYWKELLIGGEWALITTGIDEDDTTNSYIWNTTSMPEGEYPLKAEISDPYNLFTDFSLGNVTISHTVSNIMPWISFIEPDGVFDFAHLNYTIKWLDSDPDDNADIHLYYDDDNTSADGIWLADFQEDDINFYDWDTTAFPEGEWYIYAVINDSWHEPVYNYSVGPLTIDHPSDVPPDLRDGRVEPTFGFENEVFNFSVNYSHLENQVPWSVTLNLTGPTGGSYVMLEQDVSDKIYVDGKLFYYDLPLAEGVYSFHFAAWDGTFWYEAPIITGEPVVVGTKPYLSNRTVTPISGLDGDFFTFSVTYNHYYNELATEVIANITGPTSGTYNMDEAEPTDTNVKDGKDYFYKIQLEAGTYSYHFATTDGTHWVENDEVLNSPIVTKGEPSLRYGKIEPQSGYSGDKFSYMVAYIDPNNDFPTEISVNITGPSGANYPMTELDPSDTNCIDGKIYYYNVELYYGVYSYHFAATDGTFWIETEEVLNSPKLLKHAIDNMPYLAGGAVEPMMGYNGDFFNFTVSYTDADNDLAVEIIININGTTSGTFNLNEVDPDDKNYVDGKLYFHNIILETGKYSYDFEATDGTHWTRTVQVIDSPIVINNPPEIIITSPAESGINVDDQFIINWIDIDKDDDAAIALYYDTDNTGKDGKLIISNLSEDETSNSYIWDTSALPNGTYYIYAVINDNINPPFLNYSIGFLNVAHLGDGDKDNETNGKPSPDGKDETESSSTAFINQLLILFMIIGIIIIMILMLFIMVRLKRREPKVVEEEPKQEPPKTAEPELPKATPVEQKVEHEPEPPAQKHSEDEIEPSKDDTKQIEKKKKERLF